VPVRVLQCALAEKGFWTGPIDGNFTTAVGTALKDFQRSKRLRATGLTDSRTRRLLGVS
jgi:peptidoglycan hydrolase-like protein with peptidoglycan-binding domain